MKLVTLGETLDGRDVIALVHHGEGQAGIDPPAVDQHRAGAALAVVAAFLRTREADVFAQCIEQGRARIERQRVVGHR